MKEFTFIAYCSFGKGDSGETWVDVELTDEEAERLLKYGTQADVYYDGFSECEALQDIYEKVYDAAVEQMTDEIKEYGDLDEDYLEDPNWKVDHLYACTVDFPSEFEDMLEDEDL